MAATVMVINKRMREAAEAAGETRGSPTAAEKLAAAQQAQDDKDAADAKKEAFYAKYPFMRYFDMFLDVVNNNYLQLAMYFAFILVFQALTGCLRKPEEFYVDKLVMDRIVENHFDSSHNTLESVRRVADIYEWGNGVLWPGLFSDLGPCDSDTIGSRHPTDGHALPKTCLDQVWPDGDGSFHGSGATPFSVDELLELSDRLDWSDGLQIRQVRQAAQDCPDSDSMGPCYPEYSFGAGDQASYGFNYTHKYEPPDEAHMFKYMSPSEAGANPAGFMTANFASFYGGGGGMYEAGGFIALVLPFFSDTFLPYEEGPASAITDFNLHKVTPSNGKVANFVCVRTSLNGFHLQQMCDPNVDPATGVAATGGVGIAKGRVTGAVRAHIETFWNDLKRAHYLDSRTRMVSFVLQFRANHIGIQYRINMMYEITSTGTVLPSFDVQTRILDKSSQTAMVTLVWVGFLMVVFFSLLEGVELYNIGAGEYFGDMWNVMDWANYIIYYVVFHQVLKVAWLNNDGGVRCASYLCTSVGYFDDWEVMLEFRVLKQWLSLCVCIQLLKVLKFLAIFIPKFDLATSVLKSASMDLLFFSISFVISMLAFSMMLFVQLGPVMEDYYANVPAIISLVRALFGDFDVDEIMDNSSGWFNALLFLGYLFTAVFIMLSMFLAILADAQVAITGADGHMCWKEKEDPYLAQYGDLTRLGRAMDRGLIAVGLKKKPPPEDEEGALSEGAADAADAGGALALAPDVASMEAEAKGGFLSPNVNIRQPPEVDGIEIGMDGEGGDGDGGGGGVGLVAAQMDELLQAVDTIGGMLIELNRRMEAQEDAMGALAADTTHALQAVSEQAALSHEGQMTWMNQMEEVVEGLGEASIGAAVASGGMASARGALSARAVGAAGGARPTALALNSPSALQRAASSGSVGGLSARGVVQSPHLDKLRLQNARTRALFRNLRQGSSPRL